MEDAGAALAAELVPFDELERMWRTGDDGICEGSGEGSQADEGIPLRLQAHAGATFPASRIWLICSTASQTVRALPGQQWLCWVTAHPT